MVSTKDLTITAIPSPTQSSPSLRPSPSPSPLPSQDSISKSAYRRSDLRILYWHSFVYLWMRIHASNIANTAIINIESGHGIKQQLGNLSSEQWAWCLSIFYYPYVRRLSPRLKSTALRIAFFYACGQFSGTISGLLAFAISYMNGVGGLAGWRWVFILEGIPAILMGVYTVIVDNIPKTQSTANSKTRNTEEVKQIFKDPTSYTYTLLWICHAIGGWGVSKVLPTVIYELGISGSAITQLLTMPTYTLGVIVLIFVGWLIQNHRISSWLTAIAFEMVALGCYIGLILVKGAVGKYMLVILAMSSSLGVIPILWPERIRAARGTTTAGLMIGFTNAAAQLTGIVGPQVYQPKFGPDYKVSYCVSIALLAGAIVGILVTWWLVGRRDQREAREEEDGEMQVTERKEQVTR
ncbi:Putative major facilitator superfamily, MFS transporter superfamily [Septoria linicola]|uniref:Major facilitator superfamily, MFS transporter superfamily n=1 Tax=Septoria linicola TaxID=215465 RepID=A0A9Q9ASZ7_9PEZI|nr:putative major facilitator superfamily, MFS transporter superfamily [Septoria linicola]USW54114.1 Putative major facilitator superfamily, MFS transporter superfamily [Septoria linicola]